jgi:predicted  nucleic acid-binding Zn-ribbon protein
MTLLSGVMGQKKNTHAYRRCIETEIDKIKEEFDKPNKQILALAQVIDDSILSNINYGPPIISLMIF